MAQLDGLSDAALLIELGDRLARQRLQRNLTQAELAREAGISKRTLVRLESGESSQMTNLLRVLRALGLLGNLDALLPTPVTSPIAQLQASRGRRTTARARERRRASPRRANLQPPTPPKPWTWGDEADRPPQSGGAS